MVNPLSSAATQPTTEDSFGTMWGQLFQTLSPTIHETGWLNWGIFIAFVIAGLLLGRIAHKALVYLCKKEREWGRPIREAACEAAMGPQSLLCLVAGCSFGAAGIAMSPEVAEFAKRLLLLLGVVVVGWYLYNAIEVIDLVLRQRASGPSKSRRSFVKQVPIVRRMLRLLLIIVLALFTAQNVFGGDVSSWLAGLGIAGLAVTLSAQDSIKNFFGSITILLDRPFQIGDYIVIDGYEGTVEEVGFRSTRLRRNEGSLVTIPNSKAVEQSISNFSRRDGIRRTLDILVPYTTPIEKLHALPEELIAVLKVAELHDHMNTRLPPQVWFVEQSPIFLTFRIVYWFKSNDKYAYYRHAHDINMSLLEYFHNAQLEVRFNDVDVMVGKR